MKLPFGLREDIEDILALADVDHDEDRSVMIMMFRSIQSICEFIIEEDDNDVTHPE